MGQRPSSRLAGPRSGRLEESGILPGRAARRSRALTAEPLARRVARAGIDAPVPATCEAVASPVAGAETRNHRSFVGVFHGVVLRPRFVLRLRGLRKRPLPADTARSGRTPATSLTRGQAFRLAAKWRSSVSLSPKPALAATASSFLGVAANFCRPVRNGSV